MDLLIVPGTLESLGSIGRYVLAAADAAGLDRRAAYHLHLAVDEVATNTITHGYEEAGRTGSLTIRADLDAAKLTITMEDSALPFDPRGAQRPEQIDLPLEERPIGGLGLYLTAQSVDEFRYEYADGRNRNIFVVKRPSPSPST
jgi:anti-sigma regulatory factor (Ser/Thr protein kinase)